MLSESRSNRLSTGAAYFFRGVRLMLKPELRPYILVPLLVNCVLFFGLTYALFSSIDHFMQWDINLPAWLEILEKTLKWVAWILIVALLVISYGYAFNVITNIIAAPFYGLLAQKTEALVAGTQPADEPLLHLIPRVTLRELQKLLYFIVRGIFIFLFLLLLGTVPILNFTVPVVGAVWGAWCMAIQYCDYPADNHQMSFARLRKTLRKSLFSSLGFGGTVMGISMIPIINIIAMPAAVTGGTLFWIDDLRRAGAGQAQTPARSDR